MRIEPLGTILLNRKAITESVLMHTLALQKRQGGRLGDILVAEGALNYLQLYQAVAEHYGIPYVNLLESPPNPALLEARFANTYLKLGVLPHSHVDGTLIIALAEINEKNLEWCKQQYDVNIRFVCTSPFDIRRTIERLFSKDIELKSRLSLWQRSPDISARETLNSTQKLVLQCLLLMTLMGLITFPIQTALIFIVFCHVAYAATMCFKLLIFSSGAAMPTIWRWKKHLTALDESSLPVYTILIPMYRETESIRHILDAMQNMDYPKSKLDIKLVLEIDDKETIDAAYALKPRYNFDIIRVPVGLPRTKPRASNYALRFARGELVTIYDADDRPDPLQLKKAVIAFSALPPNIVCLQARLNYYNADDNLLTRFFSLEYSILFHFMLYGLQRLGIPIPLGGTSNHMHLKRLQELGEWDPYNVTEDADLGARMAAHGLRTAMLDSFTMEEAPNQLLPWINQRSRWIKGYMQTWLVHMRNPLGFLEAIGLRGFLGFQFFVGFSCFTFLTAPIVWVLSILWVGQIAEWHQIFLPEWLLWLTGGNLFINIFTHWYMALYSAWLYRLHILNIAVAGLLFPFYLVLHSLASYKALWQLIVKPHFWEKTTHGLARSFDTLPIHAKNKREKRALSY